MQATFNVTLDQTMDFAEAWKSEGLFVPMEPVHIKFATDWANIVLKNFIQQMIERSQAAKAAQSEPERLPGKQVIMEGVQ